MKNGQKGIWIGAEDLNRDEDFLKNSQNETQAPSLLEEVGGSNYLSENTNNRRDFLKALGFGVGAATVAAGCEIPIKRAIPYVVKPDEIIPGVATYYASSFVKGGDFCSILVKTREGRPIKIEGNSLSPVTKGGTSARSQAYVLSLYDTNRFQNPLVKNEDKFDTKSWADFDTSIKTLLRGALSTIIVTNTILSPTTKRALELLKITYPNVEILTYDPVSSAAILEANATTFGERVVPDYRFDNAKVIVSFGADFLGTWISPVEYAKQYAVNRKIKDVHHASMSRHYQIESHMSMTGSNADNRILIKPSEKGVAIGYLYQEITGNTVSAAGRLNAKAKSALKKVATQLRNNPGASLVVSDSNNVNEQRLINAINQTLGNYGHTLSFEHASLQRQGNEKSLSQLSNEIKSGQVDTVIFYDCNPIYDSPIAESLKEDLSKVKNKIGLLYQPSETAELCNYIAPIHHGLESWGDAEPKRGQYSLIQPTIAPLFNTRQAESSILIWSNNASNSTDKEDIYLPFLKENWKQNQFAGQNKFLNFQTFWDAVLHDGVYNTRGYLTSSTGVVYSDVDGSTMGGISLPSNSELEIQFFEPVSIGNGVYADNPWLQEMPDPVTRYAWGNVLLIPVEYDGVKKFIGYNKLNNGDMVRVTIGEKTLEVPVYQQFGIMPGTVALSLGYGRTFGGMATKNVGVNVNNILNLSNVGLTSYYGSEVSISKKIGKEKEFSCVQYHHTMGVKSVDKDGNIVNADETTLAPGYGNIKKGFQGSLVERSILRSSHVNELEKSIDNLHHEREHFQHLNDNTLYPFEEYKEDIYSQGHYWGMHVDLNACIGCSACTVACMAENNVPVVGKNRVSRHQEMSWLRIDRYYYGDLENPQSVYQPMMCQHCDNAPCENVCPVNATNHSNEGLNQMAYNRCVGTRYCANNCPYKVRRFNWVDYSTADLFPANEYDVNGEEIPFGAENLTRMVLNPDVTVRSRGVIEKCSFCVQRIQEGKLTAKMERRRLSDNDVKTACQTACPTGAITFGDRNNKKGELHEKFESPLNYIVLEEINVRSSVKYSMKVHNRDESLDA